MTASSERDYAEDLIEAVQRLEGLYAELAGVIDRKRDALRRADVSGIQNSVAEEGQVVARISDQERLRRGLTERVGRGWGLAPAAARRLTARQITDRLAGARQFRWLRAIEALKAATDRAARGNRSAAAVAKGVHDNLRAVLASVAGGGGRSYRADGAGAALSTTSALFEAVG